MASARAPARLTPKQSSKAATAAQALRAKSSVLAGTWRAPTMGWPVTVSASATSLQPFRKSLCKLNALGHAGHSRLFTHASAYLCSANSIRAVISPVRGQFPSKGDGGMVTSVQKKQQGGTDPGISRSRSLRQKKVMAEDHAGALVKLERCLAETVLPLFATADMSGSQAAPSDPALPPATDESALVAAATALEEVMTKCEPVLLPSFPPPPPHPFCVL